MSSSGPHRAAPAARGARAVVTRVGAAEGSGAVAAALACAGSEPDRAALLVDLSGGRAPRPALVASASARELEERLAVHLPEAKVASRGQICHLTLPPDAGGIERVPGALAPARSAAAVVHLPPHLVQQALDDPRIDLRAALLRADLARDRALAALAVRDLMARGIRVAVAKRPLAWVASRRALFGALPPEAAGALPARVSRACLSGPDRGPGQPTTALR